MILTKKEIDRIKWQYSESKVLSSVMDSHEELRALLKEAFKRADFYTEENGIRLQCQDAVENK